MFTPLMLALALAADAPPEPMACERVQHGALQPQATWTCTAKLAAGELLDLRLTQEGADLALRVVSPDGERDADTDAFRFGHERLAYVATTAGVHRVEVRAPDGAAATFTLEAPAPRPASDADRERSAVEDTFAGGARLLREDTGGAFEAALDVFPRVAVDARRLGAAELEADALTQLTRARLALDLYAEALASGRAAQAAWAALGDRHGAARAQILSAQAHYGLSEYPQALEQQQAALATRRELKDEAGEAEALRDMSEVLRVHGQRAQAVAQARAAVALCQHACDAAGRASALDALGLAFLESYDLQPALDIFLELLPLRRASSDRQTLAQTLVNLGSVYKWLGEQPSALEQLNEALVLFRELGDRKNEANVLNSLGVVMQDLKRYDEAAQRVAEALELQRALKDRLGQTMSLINLGRAQIALKRLDQAELSLDQAGALARELGNRRYAAASRDELGRMWVERGDPTRARAAYEEALGLAREAGDRLRVVAILSRLGRVLADAGEFDAGRAKLEEALAQVDELRASLRSPALQASFAASVRLVNDNYVELLMRQHVLAPAAGHAARAFEASERSRARSLLETLVQSAESDDDDPSPLALRERALQAQLSETLDRQMRQQQQPGGERAQRRLAREVETLTVQLDHARALLQAGTSRNAALLASDARSVDEVRHALLDPDTVLLEYWLGKEHSYLWALTGDSFAAYTLPPRAELEGDVRQAHALLSSRVADGQASALLAALSRHLLGPAAASLPRRIVVVADGALQYLPFAALPDPAAAGQPLLVAHEVLTIPSATILGVLREDATHRPAPPRTIAVLADPVFDHDDARVGHASTAPAAAAAAPALARALRDTGNDMHLVRLAFTRREAQAIVAFAAPGQSRVALDFDASRETALDPDLGNYRYLHFATHGFLNNARPELSGVVLSLVDREGRDRQGFLAAPDVFHLRLTADLVVLSGCRTGLGRQLDGEGLVGLSRAFMHAGVPRVLASLWQVDDAATAALMARLYEGLIKKGRRPADALRSAQLALRAERRFAAPAYWAGFQLQGDWR